ncbi:RNA polymerase sigma-70 factor [Pedobacter gandavensis]|uniref:RNA polymerase sigma factor n=1 Tax=Pedobacter gandavensis TaxID=2679963 RepID=UPI00292F767D|nr:RNA polymerase sigma-70 factor [Pedobacter gandavensis]
MRLYNKLSNAELTILIKDSDHNAYTEIYKRFWKRLLAISYNHTKDKSDAEEIVQEVFIGLWNKRNEIDNYIIERYLATATKFRVFNDYYRKNKRIANMINSMPYQDSYDIEDQIAAAFLQEQINGIVSRLPEKCRMVFQFSRGQGLNIPEIAKEMNIAEKTVEAHLTKALKTIKDHLSQSGTLIILLSELLRK